MGFFFLSQLAQERLWVLTKERRRELGIGGVGTRACSHSTVVPMVLTRGLLVIVGLLVLFHVKLLWFL